MAKVKIRLFASLREKYGVSEIEVEVESDEFREAIEKAGEILGRDFIDEVLTSEGYRSDRIILVNGRHIQFIEELKLRDGDVIAIFPPIAGG
ncbi:MoaD/ThiS family protein [Desulfurococcus amylolyticus]|uniref:MoaD family protein n=2 Tax=Desulfurococcus TaxID=2273 RepID=B8D487_DESA1|nr:MoaD family protein [Desulfurococcus amylolyticus]ACL10918.1 MoaD family protein [Desulfurococcus amylolyticus 1221n]